MTHLTHRFSQLYTRAAGVWYSQYRRYKKLRERLSINREFEYWRAHQQEILTAGKSGYRLPLKALGLLPEDQARLEEEQLRSQEVVIADIDRNGRLLSHFGPIANVRTVKPDQFVSRRRFPVQVVARDGYLGVRKTNVLRLNFCRELKTLYVLGKAGCHVPAIMDIDFDNLTLTVSYIAGRVLREELTHQGAHLEVDEWSRKNPVARSEQQLLRTRRVREGRRALSEVVPDSCIDKLYEELCRIHSAGVLDIDITYGNIIIERDTGQPYWIDFEHTTFWPGLSRGASEFLHRRDITRFNVFFGTNKGIPASAENPKNDHDSADHDRTNPYIAGTLRSE